MPSGSLTELWRCAIRDGDGRALPPHAWRRTPPWRRGTPPRPPAPRGGQRSDKAPIPTGTPPIDDANLHCRGCDWPLRGGWGGGRGKRGCQSGGGEVGAWGMVAPAYVASFGARAAWVTDGAAFSRLAATPPHSSHPSPPLSTQSYCDIKFQTYHAHQVPECSSRTDGHVHRICLCILDVETGR